MPRPVQDTIGRMSADSSEWCGLVDMTAEPVNPGPTPEEANAWLAKTAARLCCKREVILTALRSNGWRIADLEAMTKSQAHLLRSYRVAFEPRKPGRPKKGAG